jgi:hypothetical protein
MAGPNAAIYANAVVGMNDGGRGERGEGGGICRGLTRRWCRKGEVAEGEYGIIEEGGLRRPGCEKVAHCEGAR